MGSRWSVRQPSSTRGSASCPMRFVREADRAADVTKGLLDPGFRGARLVPLEAAEASQAPLDVKRATDLPRDPTLDARAFGAELRRLIDDVRDVAVAEFLITAIEAEGPADSPSALRTTVRYDIVGAGTTRVPRRTRRRVGDGMAAKRVRLAGRSMDGRVASGQPRATANLHGDHRGGARRQRLVPPPAQHRSRLVDGDVRLGPDTRLERPSGRLGRRCGRRWTRRSVRRAAGRIAQSPLPKSRRLDLRGHHGRSGGRRPRRHGAVALCRRRQRRRSGSRRGDVDQPAAVHQRRQRTFHAPSGRLPVRAAASGRADVDHDGGLRPGWLSRSLCVRLLVFLRRRRGQGRHAGAVLRRTQRTAGGALSQ